MNFDILAISPHPDDIEIACSGTLINLVDQGYRVAMAVLTKGMLSTAGDPLTRSRESEAASQVMGIQECFQLDMKEGSLSPGVENIHRIASLIRRTRPHVVLAPFSEDRHPDHANTSKMVQEACFWSGVAKFGDNQTPHRPHRLIHYFIHWEGPVSFVVDISSTFDRKLKAIRSYHSQFLALPGDRAMTYISRPEFLEKIINRARYYGSIIGAEYGEPFYVRDMNRVDDLISWVNTQGIVG